jgi:hypothetical protein
MFNLGGGDRTKDVTQGGRTDGSVTGSDWDNASAPLRDDPSAPSVSARFGEQIRGDRENDNVFDLNRGGPAPNLSARFGEQIRGERENDNVFDLTRGRGVNQTTHRKGGYLHRHCYGK